MSLNLSVLTQPRRFAARTKRRSMEMSGRPASDQESFRVLLKSYQKEIRFLLLFVTTLAFFNFLYFLCGGTSVEDFVLSTITARPVFAIIKLLTPSDQAVLNGTFLSSPQVDFEIVRGCEGMEGILLMISAMCAFSIAWSEKLKGILVGVAFIYIFNLLRIVGLYYLMTYDASLFNFVHLFIGQSITIILVSVFFILWISRSLKKDEKKPTG
jgi:exosortase family protein XrtM